MQTLITTHSFTLDDIVHEIYGDNPHMLAPLTDANPDAVILGVHLPAGTTINLPTITPATTTQQTINLWD